MEISVEYKSYHFDGWISKLYVASDQQIRQLLVTISKWGFLELVLLVARARVHAHIPVYCVAAVACAHVSMRSAHMWESGLRITTLVCFRGVNKNLGLGRLPLWLTDFSIDLYLLANEIKAVKMITETQ